MPRPRILVIKLGALGDFLMALGPMQAIRRHHPDADLVLLTRPAYRGLGEATGLFQEVWIDPAPRWSPVAWLRWRARLRAAGFARVYDLQTSDRTAGYFRLFRRDRTPEWSGKVDGASHRHVYPADHRLHSIDRQRAQLAVAGIAEVPLPDLGFLDGDLAGFGLPARFALLIPGSSPERPGKRWPADRYGELAAQLAARGVTPVVVGGPAEAAEAAAIRAAEPSALDLTGRTDLGQLAALARRAAVAVGNDTGPTHLAALAGCPTVALFSAASDPAKTAPRGAAVRELYAAALAGLPVAPVLAAIEDVWK
ncbi:glycosyltransferase family 9 protein [Thalassobaculum sp.]|uniref:glycosyltransferase family 9 protein n=1 Tax=Thalassobaculum sp. TaxID=2022740 RepID=UPI0032EAE255